MTTPLDELVARSNRIGDDPSLVVYGGGNTSAKGTITDHLGRQQRVMWVKGSGADMRGSVDADYPGLRLEELEALRSFDAMSDEEMTDLVARALLDPGSRRPSIETLLHAFLPFTHIDHVHADAICALTNHAEGRRVTAEALGDRFAYVDWIRPGFELSRIVGDLADYDGVVLAHHGLVTWGSTTDECWEATRRTVDAAAAYVSAHRVAAGPPPVHADLSDDGSSSSCFACAVAWGDGSCASTNDCDRWPMTPASRASSPAACPAPITCCASSLDRWS